MNVKTVPLSLAGALNEPRTTTELADMGILKRTTLFRRLRSLEDSGFVKTLSNGKKVRVDYSILEEQIFSWLVEVANAMEVVFWEKPFFERMASKPPDPVLKWFISGRGGISFKDPEALLNRVLPYLGKDPKDHENRNAFYKAWHRLVG